MLRKMRIPASLYELKDTIRVHGPGPVRACGYLMRIRLEYLMKARLSRVGLRRATHMGPLSEVAYRSQQDRFTTGMYYEKLNKRIERRLKTAHLQPQESHFRDLDWWKNLDRAEIRNEMRSNLKRLLKDELTSCLQVGIELHVLFHIMMRDQYPAYESIIDDEIIARSPALKETMDRFESLFAEERAKIGAKAAA